VAPKTPVKLVTTPAFAPLVVYIAKGELVTSACMSIDEIQSQDGFGGVQAYSDALFERSAKEIADLGMKRPEGERKIAHAYAFNDFVASHETLRIQDGKLRVGTVMFAWSDAGELEPWANASMKRDGTKISIKDKPARDELAHDLVNEWLSNAAPGAADPPLCEDAVVKRATHRVPIGPEKVRGTRLNILLRGAPFDDPGQLRDLVGRVKRAMASIDKAVAKKDFNALMKVLTKSGAEGLTQWLPTADERQCDFYFKSLSGKAPFFVFDASPLVIVYARSERIAPIYFIVSEDGRLLWENNPPITRVYKAFSDGAMKAAEVEAEPFSSLRTD
jgi:hypothetical protein